MIEYALSFVAVVKAGGFSMGAKNTGVSKACLSRHVSQLETILGVPLLHRTTRRVVLTEAGKHFFEACGSIEENYQQAINSLRHDFKGMEGTLRITAPIDFGIQFLPSIIDEFSRSYPNMNIILSLSNVNELIVENNYDLAIRIANQLPDSNLRMSTLFPFKRLICAAPKYFEDKEKPDSIEALKQHRCITSVNRSISIVKPQWHFHVNNRTVHFALNHCIEVDSLFAQLDLIKRGVGIGRMPNYFVQDALDQGELIELLPEVEKPNSYVYLLYPDSISLPQKTRVFIDFMKKNCQHQSERPCPKAAT
jgi:DNA-binding transcriptional LysR family regulator